MSDASLVGVKGDGGKRAAMSMLTVRGVLRKRKSKRPRYGTISPAFSIVVKNAMDNGSLNIKGERKTQGTKKK